MDVDEVFPILPWLRHCKSKYLLIPALANPAYISKFSWLHARRLPFKHNIITVNSALNYGM
jgi:hypothetical protein